MRCTFLTKLILLTASLIIGYSICEGVTRLITWSDQDGQLYLGKNLILPYRPPLSRIRDNFQTYLKNRDRTYLIPDPLLGWTISPRRNQSGFFQTNSWGIRSEPREYDLSPSPGKVRIALFGDSFTHGDEVPFEETWGKLLEDKLRRQGVDAEVINFGVPAYGIGQAYLRWKYLGRKFHPRVVVFGFQVENIKRTVNIFRQLYSRNSRLPYSKPRFILNRQQVLTLVNSPTVPPEKVAETLENFLQSPLSRDEYWFNPKSYTRTFLDHSQFLRLIRTCLANPYPDRKEGPGWLAPEGDQIPVILSILRQFSREVEASGGIPIILHLPARNELKGRRGGKEPYYYFLFHELEKDSIPIVDPAPELEGRHKLYKKRGHYSAQGGEIVARVLAKRILELLAETGEKDRRKSKYPAAL